MSHRYAAMHRNASKNPVKTKANPNLRVSSGKIFAISFPLSVWSLVCVRSAIRDCHAVRARARLHRNTDPTAGVVPGQRSPAHDRRSALAQRARPARERVRILLLQSLLQDQSGSLRRVGAHPDRGAEQCVVASRPRRKAADVAAENLAREATSRGIERTRIVFAARRPNADYLGLYRRADLFLDTWPYNAHTTASDALWAGCPVLTWLGDTFAARVAASLLTAVGLARIDRAGRRRVRRTRDRACRQWRRTRPRSPAPCQRRTLQRIVQHGRDHPRAGARV